MRQQVQLAGENAKAAQMSAEVSAESVKLQRVAMQQWVDTTEWGIEHGYVPPTVTEATIWIHFRIENPTKFKLTLQHAEVWMDRKLLGATHFRNMFLAPDEFGRVRHEYKLTGDRLEAFRESVLRFEIGGVVRFLDAFDQQHQQKFGFHCSCRHSGTPEFDQIEFYPPTEEEEKQQRERPSA
jgi:hypothetical protein